MNDMPAAPRAAAGARPPAWIEFLGALLRPWLRIRREPADASRLVPDDATPTVYVIERHGLSDTLILEQACREAGLPSPYAVAEKLPIKRRSAVVTLSRRPRLFGRRPHPTRSETLSRLADAVRADAAIDVRLVPVSIFVGRAPDRESGWFSVLFSENWVVVGRFRRLLALLLNGRDTLVQFAPPVSMREAISDQAEPERGVRKLQRLLRVHFHRIRAVVIGPDLSHRRTVVDARAQRRSGARRDRSGGEQGKHQARAGAPTCAQVRAGDRGGLLAPGRALDLVHAEGVLEQALRRRRRASLRHAAQSRAGSRSHLRALPSQPRRLPSAVVSPA